VADLGAARNPAPPPALEPRRQRKRAPYIDQRKRERERFVRSLLDAMTHFKDAHDKLKPIHVEDAPEAARLWLPSSFRHERPAPVGNILEERRKVSQAMERALFELRRLLNDRRLRPGIVALGRALTRRQRRTKSGHRRTRTIKSVALRPGPLNYLDGFAQRVVDHAVELTLRAFGLFGEALTPESVEWAAAAPPDHSRAVQWRLAWEKLGETLATIDLPRLYGWLDRLQTFQPSPEQLRICELLRGEFLIADCLGSRLWPNNKGRQSGRLIRYPDFVELTDLGLVAHKSGSGYFLPFDPPTGFSPGIPKLVAVPRRAQTESPTPPRPAASPRRDTAS
jgi:hypothetical protein